MGAGEFYNVLNKLYKNSNLEDIIPKLSIPDSEETLALNYVRQEFDVMHPFDKEVFINVLQNRRGNERYGTRPLDMNFPDSFSDATEYKKTLFAFQHVKDYETLSSIRAEETQILHPIVDRKNADLIDYVSTQSLFNQDEFDNFVTRNKMLQDISSTLHEGKEIDDLILSNDEHLWFMGLNDELSKTVENAKSEIRRGERPLPQDELKKAKALHFNAMQNALHYDDSYKVIFFSPDSQEAKALSKTADDFDDTDYDSLFKVLYPGKENKNFQTIGADNQLNNPLAPTVNSSESTSSQLLDTNTSKVTQTTENSQPVKSADEILNEKRTAAHEARLKSNPKYASLTNIDDESSTINSDGSLARMVFDKAIGTKTGKQVAMLREELIGAARNENPETVNQRIDFYKNQGAIDDKEAEPLKAFFNSTFDNMDEQGVEGWFQQYNKNLRQEITPGNNMTPRQARLSVNQEMNNKKEGFFSSNSEDNFRNFAGRAIAGGMLGAAIGSVTDDNPEAGFVAGVVGASVGKNIAGMLRNNTDMFEGKMINSLLKDTAKGKTRPQQLEAVEELDDEALDFMDKMYKDKLTNNFGTKNMFENSALTSSRSMTLGGAALAGVAFTPKKRDHRRGFNANRGNRI